MSRELHTLNETEMGMVNEYVESGIASTHEEALKYLIESGMIQTKTGGAGTYTPEGFEHLKFHNGHQKSKFTQIDKASKKAKKDSPFELEKWYLGAKFPKDDSGNINLENIEKGIELETCPELIITHIMYSGRRFNPAKPSEAVTTTLATGLNNEHQKQMIDLKSKKSILDLRAEQVKTFGVEKYADVPKEEKIKFGVNIFGLVKTEDSWNKFWLEDMVGTPEFRLETDFLEEILKVKKKPSFNFLVELNTIEDTNNAGNYIRKLVIKEELSPELRKEVLPLVGECNRSISEFLAKQKDMVNSNSSASTKNDVEDTLEEDTINWDS